MADIETTIKVLAEAERLDLEWQNLTQGISPTDYTTALESTVRILARHVSESNSTQTLSNDPEPDRPSLYSAISAEVEHKRLFEDAVIKLAGCGDIEQTKAPAPALEPWMEEAPGDPKPKDFQAWWTAARYFARLHVAESPKLLENKERLFDKVARDLFDRNIKRGRGTPPKPLSGESLKKPLANLNYSIPVNPLLR